MKRVFDLPKVSVVFDRRKETANNDRLSLGTVEVCVYFARKRKYISTGVRVFSDQWNADYWVVRHRDAELLNMRIREQVDKCKGAVADELHGVPAVALSSADLLPESAAMRVDRSDASWLDWLRKQIDVAEMAEGTRRHHRKVLRSLESFGRMKRFEDVRPDRVSEWLAFVGDRTVCKLVDGVERDVPIAQTTKRDYFKVLKKWVHVAQELNLVSDGALKTVKCERGKSKPRVYLTDDEIGRWCSVKLSALYMVQARDRFIVEMSTGMAYQDFMKADFNKLELHDGMWVYRDVRTKTDEEFMLVMLPMGYEVLAKYGFALPKISNQKYNVYLKAVAAACGIDKCVTSHVARHTYATYLLNHGVRLEVIQKVLGHANIKTTQLYARLNEGAIVSAFKQMAV